MNECQLISIIIPAYNAGKTLYKTLNSLQIQAFEDFEVIIINDGSTDDTATIVKQYSSDDNRFKYHYQENSGVAIARNTGINLSNGRFICFLDADDFFEDTYLEKMYNKVIMEDSDVCFCGYNIIEDNFKRIRKTKFNANDIVRKRILGKINVHTTGWLIKKELIEKNNIAFPEGISWGEDFEFFTEVVSTTNKICFVDEYLTNYVVNHNENQLSNFSLDKIDKDFDSIMRVVNNKRINKDTIIEKALIDYRLQGAIIYRLLSAVDRGININEIKKYHQKYNNYINKPTFNNGLKSIKLNINRIKINYICRSN